MTACETGISSSHAQPTYRICEYIYLLTVANRYLFYQFIVLYEIKTASASDRDAKCYNSFLLVTFLTFWRILLSNTLEEE